MPTICQNLQIAHKRNSKSLNWANWNLLLDYAGKCLDSNIYDVGNTLCGRLSIPSMFCWRFSLNYVLATTGERVASADHCMTRMGW